MALSAAVTSMVAVAFLAPLFLLVTDLASDRAVSRAERDAEAAARLLALSIPALGVERAAREIGSDPFLATDLTIMAGDRTLLGRPPETGEDIELALNGTAFRDESLDGGTAVYVPVPRLEEPPVVVRAFVPDALLNRGVAASWLTLGALGLVLVSIAVFVADRLGRSLVGPVRSLSESTARLGEGDLAVRVVPDGPAEVREVGHQFNRLAERITNLLQLEREQAADLSHRLRTPLTAVRLDVEALPPGTAKERLLDDLAELERTVSYVIEEARRPTRSSSGAIDIGPLLEERVAFWGALAEEQDRPVTSVFSDGPMPVRMGAADAEAMIDAVIGNVFAHTDEGTGLAVSLMREDGSAVLRVEDDGAGFPDEGVVERGRSEGSSTGLGLDIARRTALTAGGSLGIGRSRILGGASVEIRLPVAVAATGER